MRLPRGGHAIVELTKLTEYCLNPGHPRGRHKARVFESALGIRQEDAPMLRALLLDAARTVPAEVGHADAFGRRYRVDFRVRTAMGAGIVRSDWIIRTDESVPRLISCFVL